MSSYPTEAWRQLSADDKSFMIELKKVFGNVKYENEKGPAGIIPFKVRPWKHGGHWK